MLHDVTNVPRGRGAAKRARSKSPDASADAARVIPCSLPWASDSEEDGTVAPTGVAAALVQRAGRMSVGAMLELVGGHDNEPFHTLHVADESQLLSMTRQVLGETGRAED